MRACHELPAITTPVEHTKVIRISQNNTQRHQKKCENYVQYK